jgi:hypothetical protein
MGRCLGRTLGDMFGEWVRVGGRLCVGNNDVIVPPLCPGALGQQEQYLASGGDGLQALSCEPLSAKATLTNTGERFVTIGPRVPTQHAHGMVMDVPEKKSAPGHQHAVQW